MNKENKYALVTGAFGGMGKSTVKLLLENGFTVFALDKYVNNSFESDNVYSLECDITNENSVINSYEKVKEVLNGKYLNAIIHFAGIYLLNSLVEIDTKEFENIYKINVFGSFYINKHFQSLLTNGSKIILTTSELAVIDPLPFTGLYGITKASLDKYAFSLAMELNLLGIMVSVLRCGACNTKLLDISLSELDKFCNNTKLYSCNSLRFKKIVNSIETKNVTPDKVANKIYKIYNKKNPKFVYNLNRNKLLLLYNIMPKRFKLWIIKKILTSK